MLHLISENKGGRNFKIDNDNYINWRSIFKNSEDSLTSSIFGLLFYLPVELMWKIISDACYDNKLPSATGQLLNYEFWPRWELDNTYKEPDIFIEFEQFNLIIEAKRWESGQQYHSQWEGEIKAFAFNNPEPKKPMYLLAIGGINDADKATSKFLDVIIIRCRWHMLLAQIRVHLKSLQKSSNISITDSLINILNDLILSFGIHGYVTGDLLETLPAKYNLGNALNVLSTNNFHVDFCWKPIIENLLSINEKSINILKGR